MSLSSAPVSFSSYSHYDFKHGLPANTKIQTATGDPVKSIAVIGKIGDRSSINADLSVRIDGEVGTNVLIQAATVYVKGFFESKSTIKAKQTIEIEGDSGPESRLTSESYLIVTGTIGAHSTLYSRIGNVTIKRIMEYTTLTAPNGKVDVEEVEEGVKIEAGRNVTIKNLVPLSVRITKPPFGYIEIAGIIYTGDVTPESRALELSRYSETRLPSCLDLFNKFKDQQKADIQQQKITLEKTSEKKDEPVELRIDPIPDASWKLFEELLGTSENTDSQVLMSMDAKKGASWEWPVYK